MNATSQLMKIASESLDNARISMASNELYLLGTISPTRCCLVGTEAGIWSGLR